MILTLHIAVALIGLIVATYAYFYPSKTIITASYGLTAMTLSSGTYLVLIQPTHMIHACISGVVYILLVLLATILARRKLTSVYIPIDKK